MTISEVRANDFKKFLDSIGVIPFLIDVGERYVEFYVYDSDGEKVSSSLRNSGIPFELNYNWDFGVRGEKYRVKVF